ncbi:hypothetical protein KI387_018484, partial [Taxus chinensis]
VLHLLPAMPQLFRTLREFIATVSPRVSRPLGAPYIMTSPSSNPVVSTVTGDNGALSNGTAGEATQEVRPESIPR